MKINVHFDPKFMSAPIVDMVVVIIIIVHYVGTCGCQSEDHRRMRMDPSEKNFIFHRKKIRGKSDGISN